MTVQSTTRSAGPFTGTGLAASLPFTFKVFEAGDIVLLRDNAALTYAADYTVTLNADQDSNPGGSVGVLAAAYTLGATFYVTSGVDDTQQVELPAQGSWTPKVVEQALDKLTILIQQFRDRLNRALVLPFGQTGPDVDIPADEESVLGFDEDGNLATFPKSDFKGDTGAQGPVMSASAFFAFLQSALAEGTNVELTPDAPNNRIIVAVTSAAAYSTENMQDDLNATLAFGSGLSGVYDDGTGTYTISLTTEVLQDIFGAFVAAGPGISVNYDDVANTLTISTVATSTQEIPIMAGSMIPATTNGAAAGTAESTTNKVMLVTLDFDPSTKEYAQVPILMPKSWNRGTIQVQFAYLANAGAGDVVWGAQAVVIGNDDPFDAAFGAAQTVTDTVLAATDLMQSDYTPAIAVAGSPASGDLLMLRIFRDAAVGGDTCSVDARLVGIRLKIGLDARDDA